ncbi:MAG: transglutaminase domain-containing protein [Paludibacteraceae bacterium]
MKKNIYSLFAFILIPVFTFSQTDDDNVIINSGIETYDFNRTDEQVTITKSSDTEYIATKKSDVIYVAEFYNQQSELKEADVDGSSASPSYTHLTDDEIFYSDNKVCYYELPFKYKDKKIKVQFKKTYKDPRYFSSVYLSETLFIKSKTIKFNVPDWIEIEFIEKNFNGNITKNIIKKDGKNSSMTEYIYTINNQKAIKIEPNMQGRSYIYPHLMVRIRSAKLKNKTERYFDSLDDQYAWYKKIVATTQNDEQLIKDKSDEIVAGCTTDWDKIAKLLAWTQNNIRYIAFEDGMAAFKPDEAQEVIRKKYGDCKGMANLLTQLLVAQGYDARLTWVGTNHIAYDYSTPSLIVDNHMICTLYYKGNTYFLDPTVDYLLPGEISSTIQGRQALVYNEDKYILERIPELSPSFNNDSLACEYKIENGKLAGKATYNYSGESKFNILSIYHNTPIDKRELMLKVFFEKNNVLNKMNNIDISGLNDNAKTVRIQFDVENQSTIQHVNNEYYLGLDMDKDINELTIDTLKRENNFLFAYKHSIIRNITLLIPQDYAISYKPANFVIDKPNYYFSIDYTFDNNKVVYHKKIVIKKQLINKSDFRDWNKDIRSFNEAFLEQIVLTKK